MKNSIEAHIAFSYKGENYDLSTTIDLDAALTHSNELPNMHQILARKNNIDTYSYLYEIMESYEITYRSATGYAGACLKDGKFEIQKFQQLRKETQELDIIQAIAKKHLNIDDLNQQPGMKMALLEALRQDSL